MFFYFDGFIFSSSLIAVLGDDCPLRVSPDQVYYLPCFSESGVDSRWRWNGVRACDDGDFRFFASLFSGLAFARVRLRLYGI